MPRNQSEKLPSCPEAIAYADACEAVINGANHHVALSAWTCFNSARSSAATTVDRHARVDSPNWRQKRIAFIRKTYGA